MNKVLLDNYIGLLQESADMLYQENIRPAYSLLAALFPKLEELTHDMSEEQKSGFVQKLQIVMDAMSENDSTMVADTIQYELIEYMVGMKNEE